MDVANEVGQIDTNDYRSPRSTEAWGGPRPAQHDRNRLADEENGPGEWDVATGRPPRLGRGEELPR